ncbi:hypothetical protein HMPREF0495_01234 [Levilactobacillus brevis ATCC 14869 = DSM 20054]|uniref:Uncharacterized protein n=1 Tax=Levilactobacillus brevis ATCC 14869 = DSM 20054 TaxID=649758 RepID=U2QRS9_LEVBR|nr:hypothetical protein HMPREF0495_01234 [Levilactobacillus brevis ATCC 14869 = DSM 20054]
MRIKFIAVMFMLLLRNFPEKHKQVCQLDQHTRWKLIKLVLDLG